MFGLTPYRRNQGVARRDQDIFDIDNLFESFFNDSLFPTFYTQSRNMKVDIKENEKDYVIEAELPGVDKEAINLEINHDLLTISVNHNEQINEEKENYIRRERRYSSMCRSFQLDNVRQDDISAKFENGILSVTLPKDEAAKPKTQKIDIQ